MEIVGRTLLGKYKVERLLGQGGMGSVWLGTHVITGRQVAVKVLDDRFLANTAVVQRFGREARAASAIQHEGIVEVLDLDMTEEGVPFLVMEFLEGESLATRIERKGKLSEEETVRLGVQLLDALNAAHDRGVIHRDLKPDNVFVVPTGRRGERVKILDFGISSKNDEVTAKLTVTGSVLGTPHYMSPEQASGDQDLDRRADIYAAGVLLYECVVGQVPFDAPNYNKLLRTILEAKPISPIERGAMISRNVEAVILNAMHGDREERPPTANALKAALLAAHQTSPTDASRRNSRPPMSGSDEPRSSPEAAFVKSKSAPPPGSNPPSPASPSKDEAAVSSPRWDLSSLEASAPPPTASRSRSRLPAETPSSASASAFDDLVPVQAGKSKLEIDVAALETTKKARTSPPHGSPLPAPEPEARRSLPPRSLSPARSIPEAPPEEKPAPPPENPWSRLSPEVRRYILLGVGAAVLFGAAVFGVRSLVRPESVRTETEASLRAPVDVPDEPTLPSRDWVLVDVEGVPPGAQLRLDGLPGVNLPLRIRRGTTHTLEIRAPGYVDQRLEIQGVDGSRVRAEMRPMVGGGEIRP